MDITDQQNQQQPNLAVVQVPAASSASQPAPQPEVPTLVVDIPLKSLDLSEAQSATPPTDGKSVFSVSAGPAAIFSGSKKLWVWAAAGLLIIGLASLGVYVYLTFFTTEPPPEKIAPTPLPNPAISMEKELDGIESDLNSLEADTNVEENLDLDFTL